MTAVREPCGRLTGKQYLSVSQLQTGEKSHFLINAVLNRLIRQRDFDCFLILPDLYGQHVPGIPHPQILTVKIQEIVPRLQGQLHIQILDGLIHRPLHLAHELSVQIHAHCHIRPDPDADPLIP